MFKEFGLYQDPTYARKNYIDHKSLMSLLLESSIGPVQIELAWALFQSAVGKFNPSHRQAIGEVLYTLRGEQGDPHCIRQAHILLARYFDFELENSGHELFHQLNEENRLRVLRFARILYSTGWQINDHLWLQRKRKSTFTLNHPGIIFR